MGFLRKEAAPTSSSLNINNVLIAPRNNRTMHLPIVLHGLKQTVETTALINLGATGNSMDPCLLPKGIFKLTHTPTPITAYNVDGTPNTRGTIQWTATISFSSGTFSDMVKFMIVRLSQPQVILGMPWLQKWNPKIDWT